MTDTRAMAEPLGARAAAEAIIAAQIAGETLVTITVVSGPGVGQRLLIYADGRELGDLGSAVINAKARAIAAQALRADQPELHQVEQATLFAEALRPTAPLVIVGAGHIAVPLAELGIMTGFDVTVLDDRDEFATQTRFNPAASVLRVDFSDPFEAISLHARTYVILVTRAHKYDYDCLRRLLLMSDPPAYIGMIGSRRRVRAAFHGLAESGIGSDRIARVHAPVGLDIGAETPAEIAVSIAAELIRVRSGQGTGAPIAATERVLERFFPTESNA